MVGVHKVLTCLEINKDWSCRNCKSPYEFTLIAWTLDCRSELKRNFVAKVAPRHRILQEIAFLKKIYSHVSLIVNISPSFKDKEVSKYILNNFYAMKPKFIDNTNKEYYRNFIIKLFLYYFVPNDESHFEALGICNKCGHIFLKNGGKDVGCIFVLNHPSVNLLSLNPNWTCCKCEKATVIIYSLGGKNYCIASGKEVLDKKCQFGKLVKKYSKMYPSLKLYSPRVSKDFIQWKASLHKKLGLKGIRRPEMSEDEVIKILINIYKHHVINYIHYAFRECSLCNLYTDDIDEEHGGYWKEPEQYPLYRFIHVHQYCNYHFIRKILFWNTDDIYSFSQILGEKILIVMNSDIILWFQKYGMKASDLKLYDFTNNHLVITENCNFGPPEAVEGRLMILINRRLFFNYEKLSFSQRCLFIKIDLLLSNFILGLLHWPTLECENSNEFDSLLIELDEIIKSYNMPGVNIIIGGNFNCRVGDLNNELEDGGEFWKRNMLFKRNSLDKKQDCRGQKLAKLMTKHKFVLCNGRTHSDYPGKSTDPDRRRVTDLIWVSDSCRNIIHDMQVLKLCPNGIKCSNAQYLELDKVPG